MVNRREERRRLDTLRQVPESVTRRVGVAGKAVTEEAAKVPASLQGVTVAALNQVQATPGRLSRLVFRECPVPVFLLPTGSGPNDFCCSFQFDEMLVQLRSGVLVRPILEVWAGRNDVVRDYLGQTLKEEFSRQFQMANERDRRFIEVEMSSLLARVAKTQSNRQRASEKLGKDVATVTSTVIAGVLSLPTIVGPMLFFTWAIFGTRGAMSAASQYLRLSQEAKGLEQLEHQLEHQRRELDARLDSKNKAFRRAVKALQVYVHPVLQDVVKRFCQVDVVPFVPTDVQIQAAETPDVLTQLQLPEYGMSILPKYRRSLDAF